MSKYDSVKSDIVVIGCGGFGREVMDWAEWSNKSSAHTILGKGISSVSGDQLLGFLDTDKNLHGKMVNGKPVLGDDSWIDLYTKESGKKPSVLIGVGHPHIKRKIYEKIKDKAIFPNLISPDVVIGSKVQITPDSGVIITPGNLLSCNIKIGKLAMLNFHCTVGHDCIIDNFVTVSPGVSLSGYVHLKEGSYIGTGASTLEGTTVGSWSTVGGCAFVNRDVPDNTIAVGVPANVIKNLQKGWHLK